MDNRQQKLDSRKIEPGKYRHYKGSEYQVIDTAYHSETQELLVLYRPLYGAAALWVRPFEMFVETLTIDNELVQRFQFLE